MESIGKLALALSKAQGMMRGAKKDADNPFFKSKYADLASVWDACREPLAANELSVAQPTEIIDGNLVVKTILMHSSGESITGILPVMVGEKATAQQVGSAITYCRRYSLASMIGVAPEDDDGNEASKSEAKTTYKKPVAPSLKSRADNFVTHIKSQIKTQQSLTSLVAANNSLLLELKEKLPEEYESVSVEINKMQQAFQQADYAATP